MIPTNEQINQAVAELCGWTNIQRSPQGYLFGDSPHFIRWVPLHDFCTDRNALPEVWRKVGEEELQMRRFITGLAEVLGNDRRFWSITAEPRFHCIAALKACNKWPEDWELE